MLLLSLCSTQPQKWFQSGLRKLGSLRRSPKRTTGGALTPPPPSSSSPSQLGTKATGISDPLLEESGEEQIDGGRLGVTHTSAASSRRKRKDIILSYCHDTVSLDSVSVSSLSEFSETATTGTDERSIASPVLSGGELFMTSRSNEDLLDCTTPWSSFTAGKVSPQTVTAAESGGTCQGLDGNDRGIPVSDCGKLLQNGITNGGDGDRIGVQLGCKGRTQDAIGNPLLAANMPPGCEPDESLSPNGSAPSPTSTAQPEPTGYSKVEILPSPPQSAPASAESHGYCKVDILGVASASDKRNPPPPPPSTGLAAENSDHDDDDDSSRRDTLVSELPTSTTGGSNAAALPSAHHHSSSTATAGSSPLTAKHHYTNLHIRTINSAPTSPLMGQASRQRSKTNSPRSKKKPMPLPRKRVGEEGAESPSRSREELFQLSLPADFRPVVAPRVHSKTLTQETVGSVLAEVEEVEPTSPHPPGTEDAPGHQASIGGPPSTLTPAVVANGGVAHQTTQASEPSMHPPSPEPRDLPQATTSTKSRAQTLEEKLHQQPPCLTKPMSVIPQEDQPRPTPPPRLKRRSKTVPSIRVVPLSPKTAPLSSLSESSSEAAPTTTTRAAMRHAKSLDNPPPTSGSSKRSQEVSFLTSLEKSSETCKQSSDAVGSESLAKFVVGGLSENHVSNSTSAGDSEMLNSTSTLLETTSTLIDSTPTLLDAANSDVSSSKGGGDSTDELFSLSQESSSDSSFKYLHQIVGQTTTQAPPPPRHRDRSHTHSSPTMEMADGMEERTEDDVSSGSMAVNASSTCSSSLQRPHSVMSPFDAQSNFVFQDGERLSGGAFTIPRNGVVTWSPRSQMSARSKGPQRGRSPLPASSECVCVCVCIARAHLQHTNGARHVYMCICQGIF